MIESYLIHKGVKVRHYKYDDIEEIVDVCKVKINNVWQDGVIYKGIDRHTNLPTIFVRELESFICNFEIANE